MSEIIDRVFGSDGEYIPITGDNVPEVEVIESGIPTKEIQTVRRTGSEVIAYSGNGCWELVRIINEDEI